jgi:hypothetical protein
VFTVDLDDTGRVTAIYTIANPDKLKAVAEGRTAIAAHHLDCQLW